MVKLLGEIKVEKFLSSIVDQLSFENIEKKEFMYSFPLNNSICSIGYEREKKLLSKMYHLTISIETKLNHFQSEKQEVNYLFHKRRWVSRKANKLIVIANTYFSFDWSLIDFEKLNIIEEGNNRILKMTILPGSYTTLLFPPLTQGIPLLEEEIICLKNWIKLISRDLNQQVAL